MRTVKSTRERLRTDILHKATQAVCHTQMTGYDGCSADSNMAANGKRPRETVHRQWSKGTPRTLTNLANTRSLRKLSFVKISQ